MKVDWSRSNCSGLSTEFFYLEEEFLKNKYLSHRQMRRVCFACPIRQQCLEVGFANERFGMWGGVSSAERNEIVNDKLNSRFLEPLKRDLEEFGITFEEVLEASNVERRLM